MNIDVFTLFPGWFDWFLEQRHVRNALSLGHSLETVDLRATTPLKAGQVDDTPYGGGAGMVIRVDVVEAALAARYGTIAPGGGWWRWRRVGASSTTRWRPSWRGRSELTLLSGRYEGFDERVNEHLATDVVSIGPYVLAGGELAAMVVCDAVLRKLPGRSGTRRARSRSRSARRSRARPSTRTTRARSTGAGTPCRRSCCPATTPRCASGGSSAAGRQRRREVPIATAFATIRRSRDRPVGRSRLFYVRRHRKHRACPAAARARLPGGRPRARALPGRGGQPPPHPGVRGDRDQAPGQGRARDLHGAQAVVRRGGGADVPAALAEDREDRGGLPRRRAPGQALLPARAGRPRRPRARAPLDRRAGRAGLRRGRDARGRRAPPGRGGAGRGGRREEAPEASGGRGGRRGGGAPPAREGAPDDAAADEAAAPRPPEAASADESASEEAARRGGRRPTRPREGEPPADEPDEQPSS